MDFTAVNADPLFLTRWWIKKTNSKIYIIKREIILIRFCYLSVHFHLKLWRCCDVVSEQSDQVQCPIANKFPKQGCFVLARLFRDSSSLRRVSERSSLCEVQSNKEIGMYSVCCEKGQNNKAAFVTTFTPAIDNHLTERPTLPYRFPWHPSLLKSASQIMIHIQYQVLMGPLDPWLCLFGSRLSRTLNFGNH